MKPMPKSTLQGKTRVQSVQRACQILRAFNCATAEWGVSDLHRHLHLPKSVVFRLLQTLEDQSFVEQDSVSHKYRLGRGSYEMAALYARSNDLIRVSEPFLKQLVAQTRFTAQLGVLDGRDTVSLLVVQSPMSVRVVIDIGDRKPAHASATGKVLLAGLSDETVRALLSDGKLIALTADTLTDIKTLLSHLDKVRDQGYALNRGESTEGIMAVAAPIHDHQGRTVAAVSLGWPAQFASENQVPDLIKCVVRTAKEISQRLGGHES
jgi:DNA-binding IclR family transcriptional regulator